MMDDKGKNEIKIKKRKDKCRNQSLDAQLYPATQQLLIILSTRFF
jgi:hypothetical protein